jgi:Ca2+-binding EF-hand superfamily protein
MTNLTPIQLEEFESVFRHFDRDLSNSLQEIEFSAALASLGLVYDEVEMHQKFTEISGGRQYVTFEGFIRFMVDVTEDQNTAEQVFESFKEVADGKVNTSEIPRNVRLANKAQPYVTELDLRHSLIPEELVEELVKTMPAHDGSSTQEDRNLPKYDYISFMERFMGGPGTAHGGQHSTFAPIAAKAHSSSPSKATNGLAATIKPGERRTVDIF